MAILMASTPPWPSMSAYTPDMSVMKPMRTTSPEICACAAPARPSAPRQAMATVLRVAERGLSICRSPVCALSEAREKSVGLDTQVFVQLVDAARQLGLRELLDHLAVLHHQEAVGQRRGE